VDCYKAWKTIRGGGQGYAGKDKRAPNWVGKHQRAEFGPSHEREIA